MTRRRRAAPWLIFGLVALAGAPAWAQQKHPQSVSADFDGDGKPDKAAIEKDAKSFHFVVTRGAGGRHVLEQGDARDASNLYVQVAPPATYHDFCDEDDEAKCPPPIKVTRPSPELVADESASVLFYWTGKAFKRVQTGD